jgi:hypothetical protein
MKVLLLLTLLIVLGPLILNSCDIEKNSWAYGKGWPWTL